MSGACAAYSILPIFFGVETSIGEKPWSVKPITLLRHNATPLFEVMNGEQRPPKLQRRGAYDQSQK